MISRKRQFLLIFSLIIIYLNIHYFYRPYYDFFNTPMPERNSRVEVTRRPSVPKVLFRNKSITHRSNNVASKYLELVNTLFTRDMGSSTISSVFKDQLQQVIRSGEGLKPYATDFNGPAWIENGIVYRPRRPQDSTLSAEDVMPPSPYKPEYEIYVPFNESEFFEGRPHNASYKAENQKKIILWHMKTRYFPPTEKLQPLDACPEFPCFITTNKIYLKESSAVLFTAQILDRAPPQRRPDQIFVLHNHEPPYVNEYFQSFWQRGFKQSSWKRVFNWTMTYRFDSDFVVPYGVVRRRPSPPAHKKYNSIVANKTRIAAWLVSNCNTFSERIKYVKELKKYLDIDIFGNCGKLKCPHAEGWKCADMITRTYKFYLSFESAICPDYVTEKFFHYLTMDTVVVARGSDDYFKHAPREIFLNTADFKSPKMLAEKMIFLHEHDDAYIQILQEKDKYMSLYEGFPVRKAEGFIYSMGYRFEWSALCHICQRLWNLDKYAKSVPDIHEWFDKKICKKPEDLVF